MSSTSLSALLEDDDGTPAATLRRLGADVAKVRVELAAVLGRRARIAGGSLSLDPRARQLFDRAEDEAKRLQDEYVSTEHLLLGLAEAGGDAQRILHEAAPAATLCSAARAASAATSASPRRTPRAPTRRSRSTAAT